MRRSGREEEKKEGGDRRVGRRGKKGEPGIGEGASKKRSDEGGGRGSERGLVGRGGGVG